MDNFKSEFNCNPILYLMLKPPAVFLFKVIFRPVLIGVNNIPSVGGVVLAGNHKSSWDCFMVMASTGRCVHFLAKSELFGNFFTKWFFTKAGLISVNRNIKDKSVLLNSKKYLENGCVVAVFPEGRVKKDGEKLLPFKIGAVKMAKETKVPIVPFTIKGKYVPFFGKIQINFNKPIYISSDNLSQENEKLRQIILSDMGKR